MGPGLKDLLLDQALRREASGSRERPRALRAARVPDPPRWFLGDLGAQCGPTAAALAGVLPGRVPVRLGGAEAEVLAELAEVGRLECGEREHDLARGDTH